MHLRSRNRIKVVNRWLITADITIDKMKIITKENAPMQLKDFMNVPASSRNADKQLLNWYNIKKDESQIVLSENKAGARKALLKEAVESAVELNPGVKSKGVYLEFGFGSGESLNFIAAIANNSFVYGFDSGIGVGDGELYERNYAYKRTLVNGKDGRLILAERKEESEVPVLPFSPLCNVCLYLGDVENTVSHFIKNELHGSTEREYISFVFIDINDSKIVRKVVSMLFQYLSEKTILVTYKKLVGRNLPIGRRDIDPVQNASFHILTQKNVYPNLQELIRFPPDSDPWRKDSDSNKPQGGRNVLHFNSKNRYDTFHSYASVRALLKDLKADGAHRTDSDSEILKYAVELSRKNWAKEKNAQQSLYFLEFGFCSGRSINFISSLLDGNELLYGFDSGEGLPNKWREKFPKGTFGYTKKLVRKGRNIELYPIADYESYSDDVFIPFIPAQHVNLVLGEIKNNEDDVLDAFIEQHLHKKAEAHLAMVFIDTDLYESACAILEKLSPYIINEKTLVVFDEAFNFKGEPEDNKKGGEQAWRHYEFRALAEFSDSRDRYGYTTLAYNENGQQLLVHFNNQQHV